MLPTAHDFAALPGLGVRGVVDGTEVIAGQEQPAARPRAWPCPTSWPASAREWSAAGRTVVLAGWDGQARGAVAVADTVKPSAPAAVAGLRAARACAPCCSPATADAGRRGPSRPRQASTR